MNEHRWYSCCLSLWPIDRFTKQEMLVFEIRIGPWALDAYRVRAEQIQGACLRSAAAFGVRLVETLLASDVQILMLGS